LFGQTDDAGVAAFATGLLGEPVVAGEAYELLGFSASDSGDIHVGWTAGGGVEMKITKRISARLEYLYADLGEMKHSGEGEISSDFDAIEDLADALLGGSSLEGEGDFKVDLHQVRVGLNVHF
jgi:outer membrane immunogenic protein